MDDFPDTPGARTDGDADADVNGGGDPGEADADADFPPAAEDGYPDDGAFEAGSDNDDEADPDRDGLWNGSVVPPRLLPPPFPPIHIGGPAAMSSERSDDPAPPDDAGADTDSKITEAE